jgi:hypothetical protein
MGKPTVCMALSLEIAALFNPDITASKPKKLCISIRRFAD